MIVAEGSTTAEASHDAELTLQWGRNLIVAEGVAHHVDAVIQISFNGAAT